jgi:hypothetical protein
MNGHRLPYLMLLAAITFAAIRLISAVASNNTPIIRLEAVVQFFSKWSPILIFVVIMTLLWDRDTMVRTKTSTTTGHQNVTHVLVHATFILLMFAFSTAQVAAWLTLQLANEPSKREGNRRASVVAALNYTFYALFALSAVDVIVTAKTTFRGCEQSWDLRQGS